MIELDSMSISDLEEEIEQLKKIFADKATCITELDEFHLASNITSYQAELRLKKIEHRIETLFDKVRAVTSVVIDKC